jgi:hypothetical protein
LPDDDTFIITLFFADDMMMPLQWNVLEIECRQKEREASLATPSFPKRRPQNVGHAYDYLSRRPDDETTQPFGRDCRMALQAAVCRRRLGRLLNRR